MALPAQINLEIVTPDRALVSQPVDEVQIPGAEGYFGVLPGHTPLLVTLEVGQLWYRVGQERSFLTVAFGFAEVLPDRVTILAKVAETAEGIDVERARSARKRAEERLTKRVSDLDFERARLSLLRSLIRLQVASRARIRG
ncbi:MAG: F0F1 ATP synthase subunit epsilon [Vicinamibacterales bacterium]|jgi:F-type H+-transporting ATPase subunit epsilon|nr:F0F1 ATP synthase subunit epsilon [Vicinamibacterales bacterium]MDP6609229.1 F0F1 ATP synthase subunit epsilon [Vicinamibacterales bacterium]|tara:strand:+ start:521 stop:943 length:423 start_codon:yes stop_codon:yes gene_type:complete